MESARLEKYKDRYKFFDKAIEHLQSYLANVHDREFVLENVSQALSVSDIDAMFLLSLAENEKLLHKKYYVYSKGENNLLGEYENTGSIPQSIYDQNTGRQVYKDNYYVDIAFEVA